MRCLVGGRDKQRDVAAILTDGGSATRPTVTELSHEEPSDNITAPETNQDGKKETGLSLARIR